MGVFADLKRRTGVGVGGVLLYVGLIAAGVALAGLRGHVDRHDPVVFLAGVVYGAGLLGVVAAVSNLPRHALVTLARRRSGAAALAAFAGTVEADGTVETFVEGEASVCFTWRVLENDTDDDPDPDEERNWELTAMGAERLPFWLVTDAGERVRVDPADASLHVDGAAEVFVGAGEDPPARVREFCREAGVDPPGDAARRYEASALCPGDRAFVLGRAVEEGGTVVRGGPRFAVADAGYPDRVAGRVTGGLLLGVPTAAAGLVAVLFAAGAL